MAVALEGRRQNGRRPNSNQYKKLTTNVEEAMPSLDKPGGGDKNFIYWHRIGMDWQLLH